jgi:putative hydrolase of the HAD superfamily
MSEGIKAILFDLGNVLVDFDYSIAVRRVAHFSSVKHGDIAKLLSRSSLTAAFEEGKISPEDFFAQLKAMLGLNISYARFVPIWNEVFFLSAKNRLVFSLANSLKEKYSIAVLSNINVLHYNYIREYFPVFGIFRRVFASCDMGMSKPCPDIYLKALDELKVKPEEAFYTDDREELVNGAKKLKINSFVFTDAARLKKDLLGLGVALS